MLFTGSGCQRWSESIFNTCPCFHKKCYTSCFETHWKLHKDLCLDSENMKKSNLHLKYLHEHYVFHSLRHFGHLSYIIIETCRNKTHEIFLDIMTKFTWICFFGQSLFFWSFQTKFSLWMKNKLVIRQTFYTQVEFLVFCMSVKLLFQCAYHAINSSDKIHNQKLPFCCSQWLLEEISNPAEKWLKKLMALLP